MFLVEDIVPANLKPTVFRHSDRAPALRATAASLPLLQPMGLRLAISC